MPYLDENYAYDDDWAAKVEVKSDRVVTHRKAQQHYTAYDVSRARDIVRPYLRYSKLGTVKRGDSSKSTVMAAASDADREIDGHPFWYARVLGIFSLSVRLRPTRPASESNPHPDYRTIDMFWVRWFGRDTGNGAGSWESRRLDRLSYLPDDHEPGAYGFLDPNDVIRSCSLTPAFNHKRNNAVSLSEIDVSHTFSGTWNKFYANR